YISASSSSSHDLKPIDDGLHSMRAQVHSQGSAGKSRRWPGDPPRDAQNSRSDLSGSARNRMAHMRYVTRAQRLPARPSAQSTSGAHTIAQTTDKSMKPPKNTA